VSESDVADEPRTVPLSEREGVYVHSFICRRCYLHFNIYSWKKDRHSAASICCPECGGRGSFLHFRAVLTDSPYFTLHSKDEIYVHVPFRGSVIMDDSDLPPGGLVLSELGDSAE